MRIEPAHLIFDDGFDGYCTAKPFGGEREHDRAVHHNWEFDEDGTLFCCYCGTGAKFTISAAAVLSAMTNPNLVARLRQLYYLAYEDHVFCDARSAEEKEESASLLKTAADEIERLQADYERLKRAANLGELVQEIFDRDGTTVNSTLHVPIL